MFQYPYSPKIENTTCVICGRSSSLISRIMGICSGCIRKKPEKALAVVRRVHAESRSRFGLPAEPPRDANGVRCRLCANECSIPEGGWVLRFKEKHKRQAGTSCRYQIKALFNATMIPFPRIV
jgi:ribosomal protein S14